MVFDYLTSLFSVLVYIFDTVAITLYIIVPHDKIIYERFNCLCVFLIILTFLWFVKLIRIIRKIHIQNKTFGKFPCNDYLNNALRFLLRNDEGDREIAINEIVNAINKADGRIYKDIKKKLEEVKKNED